jgi:hypothetical protein
MPNDSVPEEVLIGVRNRPASVEASLRSGLVNQESLLDKLTKTHESINDSKRGLRSCRTGLKNREPTSQSRSGRPRREPEVDRARKRCVAACRAMSHLIVVTSGTSAGIRGVCQDSA